jgi:pimeloyl-ACP methyl ester carboxylesterase
MPTLELAGRGTVAFRWNGDGLETVVLVNGSVFNYHQWDRQPLPILQRGLGQQCRFLQYDYVGIGGSSAKTAPWNMLDLADELCDLLDALDVGRVHLLGISKGSMVGQTTLIRHGERVKSFCGLGNPNPLSERGQETHSHFQGRVRAMEELKDLWSQRVDRENVGRLFNALYVPILFSKPYARLSFLERLRARIVLRMIYPALEGTHIQAVVDLFRYYSSDRPEEAATFAEGVAGIGGVPILLLNGTADTTTPVYMSRELAKLIPGAELVEFENVTHMGPMLLKKQAQPVFERYVTFLEAVLAG